METEAPHKQQARLAAELAPSGRLKAAINLGNPVLAQARPAGAPVGLAPALARRLAASLGLQAELMPYPSGGAVVEGLKSDGWDVAFVAAEPERARSIRFTPPYLFIEGACMVPPGSPARAVADLDRPGVRIAVGDGAAYQLILSRLFHHAELRPAATSAAAVELFREEGLEAVAGIRQGLVGALATTPGARVLDDSFCRIGQAIGVPRGRSEAAFEFVREFLVRTQQTEWLRRALTRSGATEARGRAHDGSTRGRGHG